MRVLFNTLCLFLISGFNLHAQQLATVGASGYTFQLQDLAQKDCQHTDVAYEELTTDFLADKDALALFNLKQTWNGEPLLNDKNIAAVLEFVKNGGKLYLSPRKGYQALLSKMGVTVEGEDGSTTGRNWLITNTTIIRFEEHPVTKDLGTIEIDVCAPFSFDKHWQVLGYNEQGDPLLIIRNFGKGSILLGGGARSHRDHSITQNRYETSIAEGDNYQFYINLFQSLTSTDTPSITSTEELMKEENAIQVFPNPTNNKVVVLGQDIQIIEVFNVNGQRLKQLQVNLQKRTEIDLGNYTKGLYFLQIKTTTRSYTKEVVLKE